MSICTANLTGIGVPPRYGHQQRVPGEFPEAKLS